MSQKEIELEVGGRAHQVLISEGENGKWIIRVDGRVATKPMSVGENERLINVGGALYRLQREEAGEFSLNPHELPIPGGTHPAALLPDRINEIPLGFKPSDILGRAKILWGIVIAVFALTLWYALGPSYEKQAAGRVEQIVSEMAQGTGPEVQMAVGLWARNVRNLTDRDELSWASDAFDKWRMEKDLYHRFSTWSVVDAELVEDSPVPIAIVTVEIEGKSYRMRVPERAPISWAE